MARSIARGQRVPSIANGMNTCRRRRGIELNTVHSAVQDSGVLSRVGVKLYTEGV
jgi:hypothetical protein